MEEQYCKFCERTLPLDEEHFSHSGYNKKTGFSKRCKMCDHAAYKRKRERKDREEALRSGFGPFEAQAMRDQFKRARQGIGSTDMEILG